MAILLRRSFVIVLTWLTAMQTAEAQAVATPSLAATATLEATQRLDRSLFGGDLSQYSDRSSQALVQDSPPVVQRRGRRAAKIVVGLAMVGASAYLFSRSRGWKHIEYEYGPNYPSNPLNFDIKERCRTSKATPPYDAVQATVADQRCALLWQPTAATVLLAGGAVIAFR